MSLREKVGQLFVVRPESLEPAIRYDSDAELPPYRLQAVSEGMRRRAADYPVGGVLLYGHNIDAPAQLKDFVRDLKALYLEQVLPLIPRGLCAAVYTQVSDVEDETNGLLTFDRKVVKVTPEEFRGVSERLRAALAQEEGAGPAGQRHA